MHLHEALPMAMGLPASTPDRLSAARSMHQASGRAGWILYVVLLGVLFFAGRPEFASRGGPGGPEATVLLESSRSALTPALSGGTVIVENRKRVPKSLIESTGPTPAHEALGSGASIGDGNAVAFHGAAGDASRQGRRGTNRPRYPPGIIEA